MAYLVIQQQSLPYKIMQKHSLYYYLLPQQVVYFEELQDCPRIVYSEDVQADLSSQAAVQALKYRYSLKYLGKDCEDILVLCIPVHEHQIIAADRGQKEDKVPKVIKTGRETPLKGYLSGHRSAVLLQNGRLIRYKGCGNDLEGFIVKGKGLRGSHFFHTAKRQLYMTNLINKILQEQLQQQSANAPLCFYEFPQSITELGLKNQLKSLKKYCCVFETAGDRRAGTHLISPLEIIFLNILAIENGCFDDFFKERQRLDEYGLVQLLTDFQLMLQKGEIFIQKYDKSKQFNNYVSIADFNATPERKLKQNSNFSHIIQQVTKKFILPGNQEGCPKLSDTVDWIQVISIVLRKIGWQMGQIKRIFCQRHINWGFFNDHGFWHCNAHLNNLIVKVPSQGQRLVLPLDFDLAFTKEEFINIDIDSQRYGERDDETFQQFLLSEYNAMEMSVSGLQIMSFKYSIAGDEFQPSQEIKQARIIFRDTLIKSFRAGMRRDREEYQAINRLWDQNIENIRSLIEFSLMVSADFVI